MAKRIATVTLTALKPGVSKNGRLYTREAIGKAVERAQQRLAEGGMPVTMLTHHGAEDDSTRIAGGVTSIWQDADGSAKATADIADTEHGRTIAALIDNRDGKPFLSGVSIRGSWAGQVTRINHNGQSVETSDDLDLDGLDFTRKPGVDGAGVETFEPDTSGRRETRTDGRVAIYESVEDIVPDVEEAATVESSTPVTDSTVEEKGAPALKSGKPAAAPTPGASSYADPGYQDDKAKRYPLDTLAHAKSAWSYVNMPKNAKMYTANQLKRIKQRIIKALRKFGVKVDANEHWYVEQSWVTESDVAEFFGDQASANGSFRIELNNGPVCVTVSSYCIDPADLDVIGRAAMAAACDSLKGLDPDMDGDIDVPGAGAEDTDNDMESAPRVTATESTPDPATSAGTETAPAAVADPPTETEALVSDETTTPAVEPSADATPKTEAPAAGSVTLSGDQFAALLAALKPVATPEPVLVGAAAESAPTAPVVEATPASVEVTETEDQRVARLVAEAVAVALPQAVQAHVEANGVGRKGLVKPAGAVTESDAEPFEYPTDYPRKTDGTPKAMHEMTRDEFAKVANPALLAHVAGPRAQV